MEKIKLVLPKKIDEMYNYALSEMSAGEGNYIGNEDKVEMVEDIMYNPGNPSAALLGEAGIGKTALVEHLIYLHQNTTTPFIVVRLGIEILGALPENIMISRMSTLLDDMRNIKKATEEANPGKPFKLILFIDEVHKLNDYGKSVRSSAALNALKEGLGRGVFPIIVATTSKEYFENLATDEAIDRRFNQVVLTPPDLDTMKILLKKHIELEKAKENGYVAPISDASLSEVIDLTDAYIRNQVNPAKSIKIIDSCIGHERRLHDLTGEDRKIDHGTFRYVFKQAGYNIDPPATAKEVKKELRRRIKGQPLAIKLLTDAINNTFYAPRDRKKPLLTALLPGTTGTGKTESAKGLAKAFFGREDAILVINGGDYPTAEDSSQVQKFIGDDLSANKQKVILLDEFEKSHQTVQFSLMRMLDEGIVRDSHGVERAINNTIILATSNLGAEFIKRMAQAMKIGRNETPDEYSDALYYEFMNSKADFIQSLVDGDRGKNNGIKPEILQRFQIIAPYLPLVKGIMALITRLKINSLRKKWSIPGSIYSLGDVGIKITMPKPKDAQWWQARTGNTDYAGIDPVSGMIAADMLSSQADKEGARAIDEIVNSRLVAKISQIIADRVERGQRIDSNYGAFQIKTNGHAFFESTDGAKADIVVEFKTTEELAEELTKVGR